MLVELRKKHTHTAKIIFSPVDNKYAFARICAVNATLAVRSNRSTFFALIVRLLPQEFFIDEVDSQLSYLVEDQLQTVI